MLAPSGAVPQQHLPGRQFYGAGTGSFLVRMTGRGLILTGGIELDRVLLGKARGGTSISVGRDKRH